MHFVMELVKQKTSLDAVHAGYKGCAPVVTGRGGRPDSPGHLQRQPGRALCEVRPAQRDRRGQPEALFAAARCPHAGRARPETAGFFDLVRADGTGQNAAGRGRKIVADVQKVLADPAVQSRLSNAGVESYAGNGEALVKLIRSDKLRYEQLAKAANIKPE
jgi:hypothetical protein